MRKSICIALICMAFFLSGCFGGSNESKYIDTAKQAIASGLKNPSGATCNSAKIIEKDNHGRAIILLDISYETINGGVERGSYWVCVMKSEKDGDYYYKTYSSYCESGADYKLDMLKSLNDWGKEQ